MPTTRLDIYATMTERERTIFRFAVDGMVAANSVPEGERDIYADMRDGVYGGFHDALARLLDTSPAFRPFAEFVDAERDVMWDYIGECGNPEREFANRVTARAIEDGGVNVGDTVRAWDFEPCADRKDRYVEGVVTGESEDGRLVIRVTFDSVFPEGHRTEVWTPRNGCVFFDSHYARNRVELLARA